MKTRKLNLDRALGLLKGMRSDIAISENFLRPLRRWDAMMQQSRGGVDTGGGGGARVETEDDTTQESPQAPAPHPFIGPVSNGKLGYGTPVTKRSAWI